ncbi:MAG: hypothetical protein ATN33_08405 [Epulopiscium sp. Nele67-Bin001]|nr:MAG: hypothetical protein BEN18_01325 [Epulopiscium sp. Nuni2H_MBin001]OON91870.1 MAG: hypothetical protein ATN33_08405 [Epulopiscium sp. Nele67-Bin001]
MLKKFFQKKRTPTVISPEHEKNQFIEDNLEIIKYSLSQKKLPIVSLDQSWHNIKGILQDDELLKLEAQVMEDLKRRGQITHDINENINAKSVLVSKILELSEHLVDEDSDIDDMIKAKEALIHANDEISKLELEAVQLEEILESTNHDLIERAVIKAYTIMMNYRDQANSLEDEIDHLRKKLLEKTEERKSVATNHNQLYNYLHDVVGYEYVNKMDKIVGE